jgi:hypothetical protein
VKCADQIGIQAIIEICLAHPVQGTHTDIADAMGEGGGQHLVFFGNLQDVSGASHGRAIGGHLQVLLAKRGRQVLGVAAGHDQLPALGGKPGNHSLTNTAGSTGDECNPVQCLPLTASIVVMDVIS